MRRAVVGVAFVGPALLFASGARGGVQTPDPAPPALASPARSAPGEIHLQMKEVEIRGEVERPEVFYIIPRKEARLELAPLSKDFGEELQEPLLPGPFEERVRGKRRPSP